MNNIVIMINPLAQELNETLSGYCLMYAATHGADDTIPEGNNE